MSEPAISRFRTGIVVSTTEGTCTVVGGGRVTQVPYADFFPEHRVERVSPGHLVAVDRSDERSEVVVWRWFDAVIQDTTDGNVRLWEPAHGSVLARPRSAQYRYRAGSRAYLSAGLTGAQWWVAGPVVDRAEEADVELGEVEDFLVGVRLLA